MTALVMLMLVTRAMAQPPDHHTHRGVLRASDFEKPTPPPNVHSSIVRGVDVWEDGMVWMVIEEQVDAVAPNETVLRSRLAVWDPNDPNLSETPGWIMVGSGAFSPISVWPHSLACGEPDSYRPNLNLGIPRIEGYAYAVGGWLAMLPGDIVVSDEDGPLMEIDTDETYRVHAWIYRASWMYESLGVCPGSAFCEEHALLRTFVGEDTEINQAQVEGYIELFDADTLVEVDQTGDALTNRGPNLNQADLVVGGAFRGLARLLGENTIPRSENDTIWRETPTDSTDAIVVLLRYTGTQSNLVIPNDGTLGQNNPAQGVLTFGSSGDDAVLAVAFNHNSGQIAVAGYYGAADMNFNPDRNGDPIPAVENNYAGGKDLFVAVYSYAPDPNAQNQFRWRLDWRYTYGTEGDDAAEGVAFDVTGQVYAAGWLGKDGGGTNAWSGAFMPPDPSLPYLPSWPETIKWTKTLEDQEHTSAWRRVKADGIGRPVFVGWFEDSVVLDPGTQSQQTLTSVGGFDCMAACYHPDDGSLEWAFRFGGEQDDYPDAVNVCQYNSARLVIGGSFRDTVQFDPRGVHTPIQADGLDGFVNLFDPDPDPEHATDDMFHVTLLLPNMNELSSYRNTEPTPCSPTRIGGDRTSWRMLMTQIAYPLADDSVVPQDGSVSLQAILSATPTFNRRTNQRQTLQVVPATRITERTAPLFMRRLASIVWWHRKVDQHRNIGEALAHAGEWFGWEPNPMNPPPFSHPHLAEHGIRHVLFIESMDVRPLWGADVGAVAAAQVEEQGTERSIFDAINGIAVYNASLGYLPFTRGSLGETIANSHIKFPDGWSVSGVLEWERNLAIIAQVNGWDDQCLSSGDVTLSEMVARFMKRLTRHFGDYDGDGVVDVQFYCTSPFNQEPTGADWVAFRNASSGQSIFADWNFDNDFDGHAGPTGVQQPNLFGLDFSKFMTGPVGGCR